MKASQTWPNFHRSKISKKNFIGISTLFTQILTEANAGTWYQRKKIQSIKNANDNIPLYHGVLNNFWNFFIKNFLISEKSTNRASEMVLAEDPKNVIPGKSQNLIFSDIKSRDDFLEMRDNDKCNKLEKVNSQVFLQAWGGFCTFLGAG